MGTYKRVKTGVGVMACKGENMQDLKIVYKKVDELTPYENNPRNNDNAVEAVAKSIKEFGFKVPIVIDKEGVIAAGHTRLKAAKELGLEEVPCIIADDLTPEQVKAFRLADNKVGELAFWDYDLLHKELEEISSSDLDFDISEFGFFDTSIDDYIDDMGFLSKTKGEADEFVMSFSFPMVDREKVENYIKCVGKQTITERILTEALSYD